MSFVAGISITCFVASYMVAWLLEVMRLFYRSGIRKVVMLGFVAAGMVAHTIYLAHRAVQASSSPLSSSYDWLLLAAWLMMGAYVYVTCFYPRAAIGLVVLPVVSALAVAAYLFAERAPVAVRPASQAWGMIHGTFLLLGTVTVTIGFVAGVMYLWQASRLKRKRPALAGFRFPSLELLERVNSRVTVASALLVAVGFAAGLILAWVKANKGEPPRWTDPVIWTSALMLAWLTAAAVFNAVYRPARHGRKVAYLTVASFGFLAVVLAVFLLLDTGHGQARPAETSGRDFAPLSAIAQEQRP